MDIEGKTVIITGAAAGIGRGIAERFAAAGGRVVVADIDEKGGEAAAAAIREGGGDAVCIACDVADGDSVRRLVAATVERWGRLDVIVNNAIWFQRDTVVDLPEDAWDRTLDVGLKGVFLTGKHGIPAMVEGGGGTIVNISSPNGIISNPGFSAYSAAKGGVNALTKNMAIDFGPQGIRTNAICPGFIMTEQARERVARDDEAYEAIRECYPVGRVGTPEDIAELALFLASDSSDFINGAVIAADGGLLAQSPEAVHVSSFQQWNDD